MSKPAPYRTKMTEKIIVGTLTLIALFFNLYPEGLDYIGVPKEKNFIWSIIFRVIFIIGFLRVIFPLFLRLLGLHRHYSIKHFDFKGKKALIITSSAREHSGTNKKTGVWTSELTSPYFAFLDSGIEVDIASIKGGEIPLEPVSTWWLFRSNEDERFLYDTELQKKIKTSLKIDDLDFTDYDLLFLSGGWGAAYDLGFSDILGEKISKAYQSDKIIGAVCHGPLGLLKAKKEDGSPLLENLKVTGVTDKQLKELGIDMFPLTGINVIKKTPHHPEREMKKAGALFESKKGLRDYLATHVVRDKNIVTGQNQNSGNETAEKMMSILEEKVKS